MNYRQRLILNVLLFASSPTITYEFLGNITGKTSRTIRRDIAELEMELDCGINLEDLAGLRQQKHQIAKQIPLTTALSSWEQVFVDLYQHLVQNKPNVLLQQEHQLLLAKWHNTSVEKVFPFLEWLKSFYLSLPFEIANLLTDMFAILHPRILRYLQTLIDLSPRSQAQAINTLESRLSGYIPRQNEYVHFFLEELFLMNTKSDISINDRRLLSKVLLNGKALPRDTYNTFVNAVIRDWIGLSPDYDHEILHNLYRHLVLAQNQVEGEYNPGLTKRLVGESQQLLACIARHNKLVNAHVFIDTISLVYFHLYLDYALKTLPLSFLIGCFGGQGTSVMLKTFIKSEFPKATQTITTIAQIKKLLSTNYYDVVLATSEISDDVDYIHVLPIDILTNTYVVKKKILRYLQRALEQRKIVVN